MLKDIVFIILAAIIFLLEENTVIQMLMVAGMLIWVITQMEEIKKS